VKVMAQMLVELSGSRIAPATVDKVAQLVQVSIFVNFYSGLKIFGLNFSNRISDKLSPKQKKPCDNYGQKYIMNVQPPKSCKHHIDQDSVFMQLA
jgi:hypothetical protein